MGGVYTVTAFAVDMMLTGVGLLCLIVFTKIFEAVAAAYRRFTNG